MGTNYFSLPSNDINIHPLRNSPFFKKQERSQIHNLTLHLKELEKDEQIKPTLSRRREIIKLEQKSIK